MNSINENAYCVYLDFVELCLLSLEKSFFHVPKTQEIKCKE